MCQRFLTIMQSLLCKSTYLLFYTHFYFIISIKYIPYPYQFYHFPIINVLYGNVEGLAAKGRDRVYI